MSQRRADAAVQVAESSLQARVLDAQGRDVRDCRETIKTGTYQTEKQISFIAEIHQAQLLVHGIIKACIVTRQHLLSAVAGAYQWSSNAFLEAAFKCLLAVFIELLWGHIAVHW